MLRIPERAVTFYRAVFGWTFAHEVVMGIDYWRIDGSSVPGGLLRRPVPAEGMGTNAFICSMLVDDFDATASAALKAGGREALPKFAVPGRCWQGYFLDPEGNTFGVLQLDDAAG